MMNRSDEVVARLVRASGAQINNRVFMLVCCYRTKL